MFFLKRRKLESWLKTAAPSPFAALLSQQLSGQMQELLTGSGLTKTEYHIDWLDDYRCIDIQGRCGNRYVDIQIGPEAFTIAMDGDEPDDPLEFPLTSPEEFYRTVRHMLG